MLNKVVQTLLPTDPIELLREALQQRGVSTGEKSVLTEARRCSIRGSLEKRLLRSVLVGNFARDEALKVIAEEVKDIDREYNRKGPKRMEEGESIEDDMDARRRDDRPKGSNVRRKYSITQRDWENFREEGRLNVQTRRLIRGSTETVEDAVKFIYNSRFRQLLAHGVKKVRLQDGRKLLVPKVRRTMTKNAIAREYKR